MERSIVVSMAIESPENWQDSFFFSFSLSLFSLSQCVCVCVCVRSLVFSLFRTGLNLTLNKKAKQMITKYYVLTKPSPSEK